MRLGDAVYNLDGLPFRSEQTAQRMRDLLSGETGKHYHLDLYPDGGFVLRSESAIASPLSCEMQESQGSELPDVSQGMSNMPAHHGQPNRQKSESSAIQHRDYHLRPAVFRTNLFLLGLIGVAAILVLMPDTLLAVALDGLNIQPKRLGQWYRHVQGFMIAGGAVLLMTLWLALLWQRAGSLYRVTGFGVEARLGIIAHQTVGLRFQDIRSMTIRQSLPERLLGVGLLEFTSAGTDGVPVQFRQIAKPARVLKLVKERMAGMPSAD
jgi:Bacterial PH domain